MEEAKNRVEQESKGICHPGLLSQFACEKQGCILLKSLADRILARHRRSRLRLSSGLIVSVLVARSVRAWKETLRWQIDPVQHESKFTTLLARLDASNCSILDLHVFPNIDRQKRFHISLNDSWLNRGKGLSDLSRLCEVVARVRLTQRSNGRESHWRV